MAGIYIHIPFCKQACHYCNFHFSTSLATKNDVIDALLYETELRSTYLDQEKVKTIYFGGGTPGLLEATEIELVLEKVKSIFDCTTVNEVTIEINPDDVTTEKLVQYKQMGINRVSLGVQSFFEEDLLYMNRSHNTLAARRSIELIASHFHNFSVDLIYGYPLLTDEKLERNVQELLQYNPPHISIYGMTVEPRTALASFVKKGTEKAMNNEQQARQFTYLMETLDGDLYEHYEISSFAKKGFRAKHNTSYWDGIPYVGLGPGAHSYNGHARQWNVPNNVAYAKCIRENSLPQEEEFLTRENKINEYVMTSLRRREGLQFQRFELLSSPQEVEELKRKAQSGAFAGDAFIEMNDEAIRLTALGKLLGDKISVAFFV